MTLKTDLANAVLEAARRAGLDASRVEPFWEHASSLFLLSPAQVVGRISRDAEDQYRAQISLGITRWLIEQDFPATAPADVDQPVSIGATTVTFWRYYPQHDRKRPPAGRVARSRPDGAPARDPGQAGFWCRYDRLKPPTKLLKAQGVAMLPGQREAG